MTRTIAVFGAGSGLGTAVAHRFGREGYKVALVARRHEPIAALAAELGGAGVEAAAFTADLARHESVDAVVAAIRERFGRIDVIEYSPASVIPFVPAQALPVETLRSYMDLFVYTPIALAQAVLPEMLARGDGAILMPHGLSGYSAFPFMSGPGPAAAALRNFLQGLHGEVAPQGVHVGMLWIAAVIEGSEFHQKYVSEQAGNDAASPFPTVQPGELADILWDLAARKDRFEAFHPART